MNHHQPTPPQDDNVVEWIELTEGKQWSRLLYPNPVCFLCTTNTATATPASAAETTTTASAVAAIDSSKTSRDSANVVVLEKNVMVLSWLTATNNHGRFMFSINKRRCTAARLRNNSNSSAEFCLCVPVQGMEELVRNVGSTTGSWGRSKFPLDHSHTSDRQRCEEQPQQEHPPSRNKKHKKRHQPRFPEGIPGLVAVPVGNGNNNNNSSLFAIQGTVAQLTCRVYRWIGNEDYSGNNKDEDDAAAVIDEDHWLGLAEVTAARVQARYWDSQRNLFAPQSSKTPPYLTFLGSQTFGYVVVDSKQPQEDDGKRQPQHVADKDQGPDGTG